MRRRWTATGRPATLACRGMVAAPHHLAARAGVEALDRGGNAVDAAIAAAAALAVVYPHMCGLGGDLWMLVWSAAEGRLHGLNASGPSARLATAAWYRERACAAIPARGPLAALTVPGALAGWAEGLRRFGRLGLDQALTAARRHASEGFPVSRSLAAWVRRDRDILAGEPGTRALFLRDGRAPAVGERMRLTALAASLEEIARDGPETFYRGRLGERIATALEAAGSPLRPGDLAAFRPRWVDPVSVVYRGHQVCTLPPNSQGFALLQLLNVVEGFDLASLGDLSPGYVDRLVAATRLAFEDRDRFAVDPDFAPAPLDRLLSKRHAAELRARLSAPAGEPGAGGGDTTYLCAADDEGNVVSLIQSLYHDFGAALAAGDTGVLMQNRGCAFPLEDGHPGRLEPGKRPFHTLMPAMVLKDGRPLLALGTMGGEGQPQTLAAIATRTIDFGYDVQRAVEAPRWLYGRTWGEPTAGLAIEDGFPDETFRRLAALGYAVRREPRGDLFGHAQAIRVDRGNGVFWGAADPRSDGAALGR